MTLIAKLEQASGPSRELDYQIALTVDWQVEPGLGFRGWVDYIRQHPVLKVMRYIPPLPAA